MFEKQKANRLLNRVLKRPDIDKAYAMVGPEDSWYDTITTVHNSLKEIQTLPRQILQIKSHDNLTLKAVYYPCVGPCRGTMIYVHGYTSHAERESAFPGLFYRSLGFHVLIPYLRAHALSEGKYISLGALEPVDIMGWVKKVNELTPDSPIVIHGLSMGGGIVLNLADKEMKNVKCLVSDAPTVSITKLFQNVTKEFFKKNPEKIAQYAIARFNREFSVNAADYEALEIVKRSKYPLLLSAGSNEKMDEILEQIKHNSAMPTDVVILPGCNHGNGMYKQTEMYQSAIKAFLDRNIPVSER